MMIKKASDSIFKKRIMDCEIMEAIEDDYFEFEYLSGFYKKKFKS